MLEMVDVQTIVAHIEVGIIFRMSAIRINKHSV